MQKPRVLVTGANGQLGNELKVQAEHTADLEFIFLTKEELPIHNHELVNSFFKNYTPQFLVNCAAYTAVDKAESEQETAFLVNARATAILAGVCGNFQTNFIHISTDYVFNGLASEPYKEDDPVDPVNAYGASKLRGEEMATEANPGAVIIRTSWVYSKFGNNFVKTMIRLMKERLAINVVNDQSGSPTYAADLAGAILQIIYSGKWIPGIYHYSNEGIITWYQFATAIKELTGSTCNISPIEASGYPTPARRPFYSALNKEKIKIAYDVEIPWWKDSLSRCVAQLK